MIGLVGPSGSGKSTLVNLICRFYDVAAGSISVDGNDIRSFPVEEYRSNIGIVLQEPFLFYGTIAENIAYGRPDATPAEIVAAARAARAHEFILNLPDGYDSLVGERGQSLSGGERQRISIARALLPDPRILILDEATSSVDNETEREIQEALTNLDRRPHHDRDCPSHQHAASSQPARRAGSGPNHCHRLARRIDPFVRHVRAAPKCSSWKLKQEPAHEQQWKKRCRASDRVATATSGASGNRRQSSASFATNGANSCLSARTAKSTPNVAPVALFPISQPDSWISIRLPDGTELACVEDPRTLPADVWQLLKEDLSRREFVPIIRRIVRVSGNSEPCEWQVETDRGPTRFVLKSEEDVRRIGDHEILILDAHGTRYHIPDLSAVDVKSRRIVEWYV